MHSESPSLSDISGNTGSAILGDGHLAFIVETMREMSLQTDPEKMVQAYGGRVREMYPNDRFISLSRRGLKKPQVLITRSILTPTVTNPWENRDKLPILCGGLLSDLIWGDEPVFISDIILDDEDPSKPLLEGMRSLIALPLYDTGQALNMVVLCKKDADGFNRALLPQQVWMSNLFGRATHNLVLSREVQKAYDAVDRELRVVADMQQSLLPPELPNIPSLELAVHYQTSKRAGGDYYDFFPMPEGKWGILLADVSGHGTPAAVIMAVTHSIAHTLVGEPAPPSRLLQFVNEHLTARYTGGKGTFVTAFYGIYDPATRTLTYCSAGHCPSRLYRRRNCETVSLDQSRHLPLGIEAEEAFTDATVTFSPGETLLLYTDGITEARDPMGEFFGVQRLDDLLACIKIGDSAQDTVDRVLDAVKCFSGDVPAGDDRTLLAVRCR